MTLVRSLSLLVVVAATAAIAGLSRVPYPPANPSHAVIRLAWRAPGQRIEYCRRLTPKELERLPVHMRREEVCEERILPYRLQIRVDHSLLLDRSVRAAGARQDRPLYVSDEVEVAPGKHRLTVRFYREGDTAGLGARIEGDFPAELILDRELTLPTRGAVLVTYDRESRGLVVRQSDRR